MMIKNNDLLDSTVEKVLLCIVNAHHKNVFNLKESNKLYLFH